MSEVVVGIDPAMSNAQKMTGSINPQTIVTVKIYATEVAAEAAASCLEANGIPYMLSADDCGGMLSPMDNYSGVKLSVAADDLPSAREVLSREGVTELAGSEDEPSGNTPLT